MCSWVVLSICICDWVLYSAGSGVNSKCAGCFVRVENVVVVHVCKIVLVLVVVVCLMCIS